MPVNQQQTPYFSVIIPSYNRAEFIVDAIEGVLNQNFTEFELIVIDDGSTDQTQEIVMSIQSKDPRIHYYYQQNSERAIARNKGAALSTGKFLIFLDSDDRFASSTYLSILHEFIQKEKETVGLYFCGANIDYGDRVEKTKLIESENVTQFDFFVKESVIPARVCLSSEIMKHHSFDPDCIVVEDTVLWTAIMQDYPVLYVPYYGVIYQIHEGNSVNISKQNAYLLRLKGLKKLFNSYTVGQKISIQTKNQQINRCYLGIATYFFHTGRTINSLMWILLSLLKYPTIETKHKLKLLIEYSCKTNK